MINIQKHPKYGVLFVSGMLMLLMSACQEKFGRLIPEQLMDQDTIDVTFGTPRVLYLIVDGARGESVRTAGATTINKLATQSIYSWSSLSDETVKEKGSNWADMLTGVKKAKHGVVDNDFTKNKFERFPLIYQRIKEMKPDSDIRVFTSSILFKEKLTTKADESKLLNNDEAVKNELVKSLSAKEPTLLVGHFTNIDRVGTSKGYDNSVSAYKEAILQFDGYLKDMMTALEARPTYKEENWLVVIASSTGGHIEIPDDKDDNTIFSNPDVNTFTIYHTPKYNPKFIAKPYLGNSFQGDFPRFNGARYAEVTAGDNSIYNFGKGPFSIELKVKKNKGPNGNYRFFYPGIIGKRPEWSGGWPTNGWVIFLEDNIWMFNARGPGNGSQVRGGTMADATWNSIAVVGVIKNNKRYIRTFTNGKFNNETDVDSWGSFDSDAILRMGRLNGTEKEPDVYIADVRIWSGVALPDELIQEYACQVGVEENHPYYDALAGYWPVVGASGSTAIQDMGPFGSHMTLKGGDVSWDRLSEYLCAPSSDDLGSLVPRNVDVPAQIISWLKIMRQDSWQFDGRVWLDR